MWKWLTIAATAYGLLGLWAVLASPLHHSRLGRQDWQGMFDGRQREPGPGMPPGPESGPPPGMPGIPPGQKPPPGTELLYALNFEQPQPRFATRPEGQAEVVELPDGNHILRWRPLPGPERFTALILPWRPASREASDLTLRLRADSATPVIIGLREGDGSVYSAERRATSDWRELTLSLSELRLGPRFSDENGQLDLDQLQELVLVHFARGQDRERTDSSPETIELDDVQLR